MRATFTTEFIYDGSEGFEERKQQMVEILNSGQAYKPEQPKGGNMIGQLFGVTSGLDLAENDIKSWIEDMCAELRVVTKVEFKIVWLFEGGDILIKTVVPK